MYGKDPQEDKKRDDERRRMADRDLPGRVDMMRARPGGKWVWGIVRKRSESPDLNDQTRVRKSARLGKTALNTLQREKLNIATYGIDVYLLLKQVNPGKDIRRTETGEIMLDGQIMTANQIAKATKKISKLTIDGTIAFANKESIEKPLPHTLIMFDEVTEDTADDVADGFNPNEEVNDAESDSEAEEVRLKDFVDPEERDALVSKMLGKDAQRSARCQKRTERVGNATEPMQKTKRQRSPTASDGPQTPRLVRKSRKRDEVCSFYQYDRD
jgi:hypothetical protein